MPIYKRNEELKPKHKTVRFIIKKKKRRILKKPGRWCQGGVWKKAGGNER